MLFDEVGWILGWKPPSRVDEGLTRNVTSLVILIASWYIREATAFLASFADRLDSDVVKLYDGIVQEHVKIFPISSSDWVKPNWAA